jgi:hypothetical protein
MDRSVDFDACRGPFVGESIGVVDPDVGTRTYLPGIRFTEMQFDTVTGRKAVATEYSRVAKPSWA